MNRAVSHLKLLAVFLVFLGVSFFIFRNAWSFFYPFLAPLFCLSYVLSILSYEKRHPFSSDQERYSFLRALRLIMFVVLAIGIAAFFFLFFRESDVSVLKILAYTILPAFIPLALLVGVRFSLHKGGRMYRVILAWGFLFVIIFFFWSMYILFYPFFDRVF